MTQDLKKCPLCKGEGKVVKNNLNLQFPYYVECTCCGARTENNYITKEEAIKAWNSRPFVEENSLENLEENFY